MKLRALSLAIGIAISGCGKDNNVPSTVTPPTRTENPTSGGTTGSKWTSTEMTSATNSCASRGNTYWSLDQWKTFCGCVYSKVAETWTYQEYVNNFDDIYQNLTDQDVVQICLRKAKILEDESKTMKAIRRN